MSSAHLALLWERFSHALYSFGRLLVGPETYPAIEGAWKCKEVNESRPKFKL